MIDVNDNTFFDHITKKLVVILKTDHCNGKLLAEWCNSSIMPTEIIDSDTPIKEMAKRYGYDPSTEDDWKDKRLISSVKDAFTKYNNTSLEYCKRRIREYHKNIHEQSMRFVLMDDNKMIQEFIEFMKDEYPNMTYCTLFAYYEDLVRDVFYNPDSTSTTDTSTCASGISNTIDTGRTSKATYKVSTNVSQNDIDKFEKDIEKYLNMSRPDLMYCSKQRNTASASTYSWLLYVEENLVPRLGQYRYNYIEENIQLC